MEIETRSFIPKVSFSQPGGGGKSFYKDASVGFIFKFCFSALFLAIVFFGGSYWYKNQLTKDLGDLAPSLERAKAAFDPTFIGEVENASSKIKIAKDLVSRHRFVSHIFDLLERLTMEEVRFSSFDFNYNTILAVQPSEENYFEMKIILKGEAKSYMAVAQQAELFKNDSEVKYASFSNFILMSNGDVSFDLNLMLNPSILSYD